MQLDRFDEAEPHLRAALEERRRQLGEPERRHRRGARPARHLVPAAEPLRRRRAALPRGAGHPPRPVRRHGGRGGDEPQQPRRAPAASEDSLPRRRGGLPRGARHRCCGAWASATRARPRPSRTSPRCSSCRGGGAAETPLPPGARDQAARARQRQSQRHDQPEQPGRAADERPAVSMRPSRSSARRWCSTAGCSATRTRTWRRASATWRTCSG